MTETSAIELKEVNFTYRVRQDLVTSWKKPALMDVSFTLRRGETLGIVGRNGSGKSTLLKILSGVFRPDSGTMTSFVKTVSLMTLSLGFDSLLSGRNNAIFGGMLLGFTKQEVEQRLEAIKEFSGLGDSFELPVKSYSSGMASRLKFAVAINLEPDVMLLDELLAVGDVGFRKQAAAVMQEKIVSEQTTVLVSHNAGDIRRLCDRAILLEHGEIIADGNPEVVLQEYQKVQNVLL